MKNDLKYIICIPIYIGINYKSTKKMQISYQSNFTSIQLLNRSVKSFNLLSREVKCSMALTFDASPLYIRVTHPHTCLISEANSV